MVKGRELAYCHSQRARGRKEQTTAKRKPKPLEELVHLLHTNLSPPPPLCRIKVQAYSNISGSPVDEKTLLQVSPATQHSLASHPHPTHSCTATSFWGTSETRSWRPRYGKLHPTLHPLPLPLFFLGQVPSEVEVKAGPVIQRNEGKPQTVVNSSQTPPPLPLPPSHIGTGVYQRQRCACDSSHQEMSSFANIGLFVLHLIFCLSQRCFKPGSGGERGISHAFFG